MFSIVVIYRPPPLKTRQDFLSEVDHLLSIVSLRYNQIYLCRDLNLRFEKSEDEIARQFLDYIADFKFDYHVQRGGSLDVICTQGLSCVSHSSFQITICYSVPLEFKQKEKSLHLIVSDLLIPVIMITGISNYWKILILFNQLPLLAQQVMEGPQEAMCQML